MPQCTDEDNSQLPLALLLSSNFIVRNLLRVVNRFINVFSEHLLDTNVPGVSLDLEARVEEEADDRVHLDSLEIEGFSAFAVLYLLISEA